jgi:hypothetical protein
MGESFGKPKHAMGWDNKSRYTLAGDAVPQRAGCPKDGDVAAI